MWELYILVRVCGVTNYVDPCELSIMTVFDLFQLLGGMSVIFYTLFVRSQYLRIENVSPTNTQEQENERSKMNVVCI